MAQAKAYTVKARAPDLQPSAVSPMSLLYVGRSTVLLRLARLRSLVAVSLISSRKHTIAGLRANGVSLSLPSFIV